jgi:hypothetical protein
MLTQPMLDDEGYHEGHGTHKKTIDELNLKISYLDFKLMVVMVYTLMNTISFFVAAVYINALRQEAQGKK